MERKNHYTMPSVVAVVWGAAIFLCSLSGMAYAAPVDEVRKAVDELEHMRWDHKRTLYEDAERRTAELLNKFTDPKDQGQIYFELTHIYGQTGGPPQRIVECAKKALQFPVEPQQRLRLYEYWGDALFRTEQDTLQRPELRKAAAVVCLEGLMEFRKIDVASYVPWLPPGSLPEIPPSLSKKARALLEEEQRAVKANTHALFVRDITQYRDNLTSLIVNVYTLRPYAVTNELRELVMEKTNDPQLADQLVKAVDIRVKADVAKYGPYVPPSAPMLLNPPPAKGRQVFMLTILLVILIVIFVVRRWYRFHRVRAL